MTDNAMFCPKCGSTQPDELRFCKNCGSNLSAVKVALTKPESLERSGWNRTWVGELVLTQHEKDRLRGVTPEQKRLRTVKAGVITASAGVGLMIVLAVLMNAIIAFGVSTGAAIFLSKLWVVGLIPIFVGGALVFNGMVLSKRQGDKAELPAGSETTGLDQNAPDYLPAPNTNEFAAPHSVTDETTKHLAVKE